MGLIECTEANYFFNMHNSLKIGVVAQNQWLVCIGDFDKCLLPG